jgi:hypothetical protein
MNALQLLHFGWAFFMQKDSIIIYRSFYEAIKDLPKQLQADAWKSIFEYGLNDNEQELTGIVSTVFKLIKPQLDANKKRFENGQKGGRPKTELKPKHNQDITKVEPNVNDNVNVNVNNNKNIKFIKPTIEDIKKEFSTFNAEHFFNYYESNGWMVGRNKMKDWKATVKNWMAKDYNQQTQVTPNRPKLATLQDE